MVNCADSLLNHSLYNPDNSQLSSFEMQNQLELAANHCQIGQVEPHYLEGQIKLDGKLYNLANLIQKISANTVLEIMNYFNNNYHRSIMINTFKQMEYQLQQLKENPRERAYCKCTKSDDTIESHAFAISSHSLYLVISGQLEGLIGEGTSKIIHRAFQIKYYNSERPGPQIEPIVRVKTNPKWIKRLIINISEKNPLILHSELDAKVLKIVNSNMLHEAQLMRNLLKDNPNAVDPYFFGTLSPTGKAICFHRRYSGDGKKLRKAAVYHQLNALKEFGFGLEHLHKKKRIHSDVKLANLFLKGELINGAKPVKGLLGDIGLSQIIGTNIKGGSLLYLPPEAVICEDHKQVVNLECSASEKIDSYGLGMTILATLIPPCDYLSLESFTNKNENDFQLCVNTFFDAIRGELRTNLETSDQDKNAQARMLDVAYKLIKFNPAERLTCGEAARELEAIQSLRNA